MNYRLLVFQLWVNDTLLTEEDKYKKADMQQEN